MSLTTPEKIRTLQRKLYRKAKAEPTFRFYLLYDKIHREDILRHAYALTRFNAGAAGVDGMSFAASDRSAFRPSGIGWCKRPPNSCWNQSSRRTSRIMSTATAPSAERWTRSKKCAG